MIRGYVAVVSSDLPLSNVPPLTPDSCRKATIRLVHNLNDREFSIDVEGTDYSFKVLGNVQTVDKRNIASGFVRIGFIQPNLHIVISCNPADLDAFVCIVESVKDLVIVLPPKCSDTTHKEKLKCICHGSKFSHYQRYHNTDFSCPFSVLWDALCSFCCYRVLECYMDDDDARKILNTWKSMVDITDRQMPMHSITVTSFPYVTEIYAGENDLMEIPESLGSLPCLKVLILSYNRLGHATNWKWLTSPFIRENLQELYLGSNELSCFPELILGLRNLKSLSVSANHLTEIPDALGNLKYLRELDIACNKLLTLPAWMYRKERFLWLSTGGNDFHHARIINNSKPQPNRRDFEILAVPSLFESVAKYIITERITFWEYNIPARLADCLEGAYYCRCGSVVICDTIGRVIHCWIKSKALAEVYSGDENLPFTIRCCSYDCFKLVEPHITL